MNYGVIDIDNVDEVEKINVKKYVIFTDNILRYISIKMYIFAQELPRPMQVWRIWFGFIVFSEPRFCFPKKVQVISILTFVPHRRVFV